MVFGGTDTTYRYVIEIKNEGTDTLNILEIKDFIATELTYVAGSVSTTPNTSPLNIGDPNVKAGDPIELKWKANKNSLYQLLPGITWLIEYRASAALPRSFYSSQVYIRLDKSTLTIAPTSVATGTPDTYTVTVENDGTEVLTIEDVSASIDKNVFTYLSGSSTTTPGSLGYGTIKITGGGSTITWLDDQAETVALAAGATWALEFKLTSSSADPQGQNLVDIVLDLTETAGTVRPADRTTGPTAVISVVDVFRIQVVTPKSTFNCDLWLTSDVSTGDFHLLEGCVSS